MFEIALLKARLAAAEEKRGAALRSNSSKKQGRNASNLRGSHTDRPHPSHAVVPAELSQSLLDRQSDL